MIGQRAVLQKVLQHTSSDLGTRITQLTCYPRPRSDGHIELMCH